MGAGTHDNPLRVQFCPGHRNQERIIAVALIRLEQLKLSIQGRSWPETEFQFDRVLRALTK